MKIETAIALSQLPIIAEIDELKNIIDGRKPFSRDTEERVFQKIKLDWNYNSNAIEGNQLNYGETVAFLMHGVTAKGKTLKDHLDIKGHNEAINFLLDIIKEDRDISESDIRSLHKMILVEEYEVDALTTEGQPTKKKIKLGTYKTTPNSVKTRTGEIHYYASVEDTPILMKELIDWYNKVKNNNTVHPIVLASLFHHQFVAIHPFDDGNGRLGRILMNLIMMKFNYLPIVVKNEDKINYYSVLAQADEKQYIPLVEYLTNLAKHTLTIMQKAINGESIEEPTDIDKEIALLKKSLDKNVLERVMFNNEIFNSKLEEFYKFSTEIDTEIAKFKDLFFDFRTSVTENKYIINNREIEHNLNCKNNIAYKFIFEKLKSNQDLIIEKKILAFYFEFNYTITYNNTIISKYYNEALTEEEINSFVNIILKDILNEIKQHTK